MRESIVDDGTADTALVRVRPVDPRDTEVEILGPVYRVYTTTGSTSAEHELLDARDVREVLEWAASNAGPASGYTVYVVVGKALVELLRREASGAAT
jgi:hypothetical protein